MVTAKNEQDSKKKVNEGTETEEKAKAAASENNEETKDPHEDGGCCGVCG